MKPTLNLLRLQGYSIVEQLYLEESLLRTEQGSWCLINEGTSPALVMGRTQKKEEVVVEEEMIKQQLMLIRRFSGGGCVVVDENTLFLTLILNTKDVAFSPCPTSILEWYYTLLQPLFKNRPFSLQGHDFAIDNKKIGGNAQTIIKDRFLQHTSFLWSWDEKKMKALAHPPKEPDYRQRRTHAEFLGSIKNNFSSKKEFIDQLDMILHSSFFIEERTKETPLLLQRKVCSINTKIEYAPKNASKTGMGL